VRSIKLGRGPGALFIATFALASKRRHSPRRNVDAANCMVQNIPYHNLRPVGRQGEAERLVEGGGSADSVSKAGTVPTRKCAHSHGRQVDGSNSVRILINHKEGLRVRREGTTVRSIESGQGPDAVAAALFAGPSDRGNSARTCPNAPQASRALDPRIRGAPGWRQETHAGDRQQQCGPHVGCCPPLPLRPRFAETDRPWAPRGWGVAGRRQRVMPDG